MDNYIQKLLREYAVSDSNEVAHKISRAILRSRGSNTEQNMYCPRCHASTVFAGLDSGLFYCTECNWDATQPAPAQPTPFVQLPYINLDEVLPNYDEIVDEDDEDEDEEHAAEYEAGEFWDCCSCGEEPFFADTQGETWALLGEAGAAVATAKLGRGDAGQALCENCVIEAGLDLEQAAQDVLEDFCEECGEEEDDCYCE